MIRRLEVAAIGRLPHRSIPLHRCSPLTRRTLRGSSSNDSSAWPPCIFKHRAPSWLYLVHPSASTVFVRTAQGSIADSVLSGILANAQA